MHAPRKLDFVDAAATRRQFKRNFLEIAMFLLMYFASLFDHLGCWIERAERHRRDEYRAEARDLAELERLIRSLERDGYPR